MKKTSCKLLHRLLCAGLVLTLALFHPAVICTAAAAGEDFLSGTTGGGSGAAGTIRIGDIIFSPDEDVSSQWSEDHGWKNLAGQYVALVDYNGEESGISVESGTVTLAVAGINRIGTLKGSNSSINIVGTGIVLIDSIEIENGSISLMPNSALYEEGSAAVFLKQGKSYLLINGDIPGILDEDYLLDNASLTLPAGSSLILKAEGVRTETWYPDGAAEPETEIRRYRDSVPWQDIMAFHENGDVHWDTIAARLVLGGNSTLTIDEGASVRLEKITTTAIGSKFKQGASDLSIYGALNNNGVIEGGFVDINDGGSLLGDGKIRSSEVGLNAGGNLSGGILFEEYCGLSVNGDSMTVSTQLKDSAVYLKASGIFLENLYVLGTSWVGVSTDAEISGFYGHCAVGNITFGSSEDSLEIVCNDHDYYPDSGESTRLVEDCELTISGKITDGTVSVLAGLVNYTGEQTEVLPLVPIGYAARVYVTGIDMESSLFPLNLTDEEVSRLASEDQISVSILSVSDSLLVSDDGTKTYAKAREWFVTSWEELDSLKREEEQSFTCASFLEAYGLTGTMGEEECFTAVEIIYQEDLRRERFFLNDDIEFSTEGAILIRVLDCVGKGGQGGSAISRTETTYTGSGVLGGIGAGFVTVGTGMVVYSNVSDPLPADPDDFSENEEKNNNNETEENNNSSGDNNESIDNNNESVNNNKESADNNKEFAGNNNGTGDTGSSNGTGNNNNGAGNNSNGTGENNNAAGTGSVPVGSNVSDENNSGPDRQEAGTESGLTAVASGEGNGRYTLTVYQNGKKLDSLNGSKVTVRVRNPEGVTENDICYAVFENNGQRKWIPAKYDKETKELVFEADRMGSFGIARVSVEEVKYRTANTDAPTCRRMSVRIGNEEIKNLPEPVTAWTFLTIGEAGAEGLYAVFVDENEKLNAFPLYYNESNNKYQFETNVTGDFVVIKLDPAVRSGSELEAACRASDEVRILITVNRLYAFWS